jgi:hypothetical protein
VIVNPWQSKPPQGTGLNRSIGLTSGLAAFWPLLESAGPTTVDLVNNVALGVVSGTPWSSGLTTGLLCTSNGTGAQANLPTALQLQPPITLAVGFRFIASPAVSSPAFGIYNGNTRELALEVNVTGPELILETSAGNLLNAPLTLATDYVAVLTTTSGNSNLYLNGVFKANAATAYTVTYTSPSITIGNTGFQSSGRNPGSLIYFSAMWNRFLSAGEIADVSANPWQMLAPNPSYWLYKHTAAATSSLFRPATLSLGAGGPFFQTPVNG